MRLGSAALALACAVAAPVAAAQPSTSTKPPLVSIVGSSVYKPVVSSSRLNIRVPLALRRGVAQSGLHAALVDVNLDGRGQKGVFDNFSLRMQHRSPAPASHRPRDVALILGTTAQPAPGTYRVRVVVIDSARNRRQRLNFRLQIAPAVVTAPPVVHVTRTIHLWPFADEVHATGIPLTETSKRSRVSGLTIAQVEAPTGASGELKLTYHPTIRPGRTREARVETSGSFPLGTATGKAQIDATELAKPVDVTYEVKSAWGKVWLWALLLASVLLGYGARVGFKRKIDRAGAKAQGEALRIRIDRESKRIEDQQFKEAVAGIDSDLETALGDDDPATIDTAVKDAHDKLDAELKALQTRCDAVTTRLSGIANICAHSWCVPPAVDSALTETRAEIAAISTLLTQHDAGEANQRAIELEQTFPERVAGPARAWRNAAMRLVDSLRTPNRSAPGSSDANVTQAAGAAYTALTDPGLTGEAATAEDLLRATHAARGAVETLLRVERTAVGTIFASVVPSLEKAGATDELIDIRRDRDAATAALDAATTHDLASFATATDALADLGSRLGGAITTHLADDADRPAVDQALESGDFVGAIRAARPAHAQAPGAESLMAFARAADGEIAMSATAAAFAGGLQARRLGPAPQIAVTRAVVPGLSPLANLGIQRRAARVALLGQNIVLGIAVIVVGYLLFADAWTGTLDNVAAVFAWGFGANLTGGFVTEELKKRKQPDATGGTGTGSTTTPTPTTTPAQPAQGPAPVA